MGRSQVLIKPPSLEFSSWNNPAPQQQIRGPLAHRSQMHFSQYATQLCTHFRARASKGFHFRKTKMCTNFGLDRLMQMLRGDLFTQTLTLNHVSITQLDLQKLATANNQEMPTCTSHCVTEGIWRVEVQWHWRSYDAEDAPHKGPGSQRLRDPTQGLSCFVQHDDVCTYCETVPKIKMNVWDDGHVH